MTDYRKQAIRLEQENTRLEKKLAQANIDAEIMFVKCALLQKKVTALKKELKQQKSEQRESV